MGEWALKMIVGYCMVRVALYNCLPVSVCVCVCQYHGIGASRGDGDCQCVLIITRDEIVLTQSWQLQLFEMVLTWAMTSTVSVSVMVYIWTSQNVEDFQLEFRFKGNVATFGNHLHKSQVRIATTFLYIYKYCIFVAFTCFSETVSFRGISNATSLWEFYNPMKTLWLWDSLCRFSDSNQAWFFFNPPWDFLLHSH